MKVNNKESMKVFTNWSHMNGEWMCMYCCFVLPFFFFIGLIRLISCENQTESLFRTVFVLCSCWCEQELTDTNQPTSCHSLLVSWAADVLRCFVYLAVLQECSRQCCQIGLTISSPKARQNPPTSTTTSPKFVFIAMSIKVDKDHFYLLKIK